MAYPQVEHGHYRLANQLDEAMTLAPFNEVQHRIVRVIARLTYGWKRRTVRISQADLARKLQHDARDGHWRRSFTALMAEGVVVEVEPSIGRKPGAYALNKNFERWGRFSVARGFLESEFKERPDHVDGIDRAINRLRAASTETPQTDIDFDRESGQDVPSDSDEDDPGSETRSMASQGQSTDENEARSLASQGQSNSRRLASQGTLTGPPGHIVRPPEARVEGSKSLNGNGMSGGKDSERHRNTAAGKKGTAAADVGSTEYESKIVHAAQQAVERRWPGKRLSVKHAADVVDALLAAEVDPELAVRTIRIAIARKLGEAPGSIAWLKDRILDAHRDAAHEALKHSERDQPHQRPRATATSIANIVETDLRPDYDLARRNAAIAWGKDPSNAASYRAIVEDSNKRFADMLSTSWGKTGRDQDVLDRCIASVPFASFDDWKSERKGTEQPVQRAKTRGRK